MSRIALITEPEPQPLSKIDVAVENGTISFMRLSIAWVVDEVGGFWRNADWARSFQASSLALLSGSSDGRPLCQILQLTLRNGLGHFTGRWGVYEICDIESRCCTARLMDAVSMACKLAMYATPIATTLGACRTHINKGDDKSSAHNYEAGEKFPRCLKLSVMSGQSLFVRFGRERYLPKYACASRGHSPGLRARKATVPRR